MITAFRAFILSVALAVIGSTAFAQSTVLQGGAMTSGHVPMYVGNYSQQPFVQDSGPAGGGAPGVGLSELLIASRQGNSALTAPYANSGTGPLYEHFCMYDAPTTNSTGYHYLCLDPDAQGGALLDYGYAGGATSLPLQFIVNGTTYTFPFSSLFYGASNVTSIAAGGNVAMSISAGALTVKSPAVGTFSSLATCSSTTVGELRPISDGTANTWGTQLAGGGAYAVLAYCDGLNWTVAAK